MRDTAMLVLLRQMRDTFKAAQEDLETWHDESLCHQDMRMGDLVYSSCNGCVTCTETIPAIKQRLSELDLAIESLATQPVD